MRPLFFLAALAPLAACSIFVTVPDLTGGASASDGGDAGNPAANADGGANADAGPAFCRGDGGATFCDDFNSGSLAAWTVIDNEGPAQRAELSPSKSVSRPSSLHSYIDSVVGGECEYARVQKQIDGAFERTRVELSFFADRATLEEESIAATRIDAGGHSCRMIAGLRWNGSAYQLRLLEQVDRPGMDAVTSIHDVPGTFPAGEWNRIAINVNYETDRLEVLDGNGVVLLPAVLEEDCTAAAGPATVEAGLFCSGPRDYRREVYIDDLVFDPH